MDTHDHAQQIYALILAGIAASGKPMPSGTEAPRYSELAIVYAQAFEATMKKIGHKL